MHLTRPLQLFPLRRQLPTGSRVLCLGRRSPSGAPLLLTARPLSPAQVLPKPLPPRLSSRLKKLPLLDKKLQLLGEKLQLLGEKLQLLDKKLQLPGEKLQLLGKKLQLLGEKLQLLDKKLQLPGKKLQLLDEKLQLLGKKLQLLGKKLQLLGGKLPLFAPLPPPQARFGPCFGLIYPTFPLPTPSHGGVARPTPHPNP